MKHTNNARGSSLAAALLLGLASIGLARTAEASPNYPGLLQAALEKQFAPQTFCVPLCTACHLTTIGGPGMLNDFGTNLLLHGGLLQSNGGMNDGTVLTSIQKWLGPTPPAGALLNAMGEVDSDDDGEGDATELQNGDSPSVPGPRGKGQFCSDLRYGCAGGRIAAAPPPVDSVGLFSAGLVVVGFAALRRRRRLATRAR
jgi:hypothetical protein